MRLMSTEATAGVQVIFDKRDGLLVDGDVPDFSMFAMHPNMPKASSVLVTAAGWADFGGQEFLQDGALR